MECRPWDRSKSILLSRRKWCFENVPFFKFLSLQNLLGSHRLCVFHNQANFVSGYYHINNVAVISSRHFSAALQTTMSAPVILLPGDEVQSDYLPSSAKAPLSLGQGLRILSQAKPTTGKLQSSSAHIVSATHAGLVASEQKRNTASVLPFPGRRYVPVPKDLVIAQIHHSSADYFHCLITPHTPHALLAQLAFEGATKKTRPMLKQGELVYARVLSVGLGPGSEVELTCVNPSTGKAEPGGLGPLNGGMVFDVSPGMAARLMRASSASTSKSAGEDSYDTDGVEGLVILEELGRKLESSGGFEMAVGRNGRVWVDCSNSGEKAVLATVAVGRCLTETDQRNLNTTDQRRLVSRVLKDLKLDA